jgi:hypothetical protein
VRSPIRKRQPEAGIALLISIFILLLISVVAIALIVASGTESSLAGNYRSATTVYYAALAGLEEARGRLVAKNPNSFQNTDAAFAAFLPSPSNTLAVGRALYITNPVGAEDVLATYLDGEYRTEFGFDPTSTQTTSSVSGVGGVQGPLYKWVRINAITEFSLQLDVDFDSQPNDNTIPIYYDGAKFNTTLKGSQVLEITSFAILPNGSQKLLQYLAVPIPLVFNAALTLDGNNAQFSASTSGSYWVKGIDQGSTTSCSPGSSVVPAVGYTNGSDSSQSNILTAIPSGSPDLRDHYTMGPWPPNPPYPHVIQVLLSPNLTTVAGLNALVRSIKESADAVVNGNATQADFPAGMSAASPKTIVINGDLTINGWRSTGYGLLLVTGKFTYDPDASWDGIILVIGKGWMHSQQGAFAPTQIQGAVFLARTLDVSGNPLSSSSPPIFTALSSPSPSGFDFGGTPNSLTNGIYYSNCWIQASMPSLGYKILSFHEISQ